MRRFTVGVKGRFVGINLVEMEQVRVFGVLEDIEPEASGFVPCRALCVTEARFAELFGETFFDSDGYENRDHGNFLSRR